MCDELPNPFKGEERAWESEQVLKEISKANSGDAQAQYDVGCYYLTGKSFLKADTAKAIEYFIMAVEQGHKQAKEKLIALKDEHLKDRKPNSETAEFDGIDERSEHGANQKVFDWWKIERCKKCLSGEMPIYCHVCNPPWRI